MLTPPDSVVPSGHLCRNLNLRRRSYGVDHEADSGRVRETTSAASSEPGGAGEALELRVLLTESIGIVSFSVTLAVTSTVPVGSNGTTTADIPAASQSATLELAVPSAMVGSPMPPVVVAAALPPVLAAAPPFGLPNLPNIPNPIAAAKALPLDGLWRQNRILGAVPLVDDDFPVIQFNIISHTFIVTTNELGDVINTFSWGNKFEDSVPSHWYANMANDVAAADAGMQSLKDFKNGVFNVLNFGKWGERVGGSDLIPYVNKAFALLHQSPYSPSRHAWGAGGLTCKQEADILLATAQKGQLLDAFENFTAIKCIV